MNLQKIGGLGALTISAVSVGYFLYAAVILPKIGISTLEDFNNAAHCLKVFGDNPATYFTFKLLDVIGSTGFFLAMLALRERLQPVAPNLAQFVLAAAAAASFGWYATGTVGIVGVPAAVAGNDPSAFRAIMHIDTGISVASDHIAGWLHLLIGLKILTTKGILPRAVGVVMVLIGVFFIPTFAVNVLGFAANVFTIIWGALLGVILLSGKAPLMNAAKQAA